MLSSPLNVRFDKPPRNVRLSDTRTSTVSEAQFREGLEERFRAGYEAGQKDLSEQLVQQRKQLIDIQTGLFRNIQDALPNLIAECEKSLVLLAIEAARKVVDSIPISAEMMEAVIRKALTHLQDTAEYEVLLHPEDLAFLHQISSGLLPTTQNTKVRFGIDATVSRGGCLIKTNHGAISTIRERMFEKLEAAVIG